MATRQQKHDTEIEGKKLEKYIFPSFDLVVEAESFEEAQETAKKIIEAKTA